VFCALYFGVSRAFKKRRSRIAQYRPRLSERSERIVIFFLEMPVSDDLEARIERFRRKLERETDPDERTDIEEAIKALAACRREWGLGRHRAIFQKSRFGFVMRYSRFSPTNC